MFRLFMFRALADTPVFDALSTLDQALQMDRNGGEDVIRTYHRLHGALLQAGMSDLRTFVVQGLLCERSSLAEHAMRGRIPDGVREAARRDLALLLSVVERDWQHDASQAVNDILPPLTGLSYLDDQQESMQALLSAFQARETSRALIYLEEHYQQHGYGTLARFAAFRWVDGQLQGIRYPAQPEYAHLVDIERSLGLLIRNTEAFLARKPAHHTLLYGPRGSGKSTAVKSLLKAYAPRGLRLVEVAPGALGDLPEVLEHLRGRPHRYILFVDDLSFEGESGQHSPLKTLLEGSLTERPENVLLYATSNRRHLVKERFSDRPDPLNDDVHAWDTQHERLALADRFGLTITFPDATQARYLKIVRGLADQEDLAVPDLEARAVRFADWGNGYSGRTARQFVDTLKAELG